MIKIKEIQEDRIIFTNGWELFDDYSQDWSEVNYAAYEDSLDDSILENMVFDSIKIEPTEYGFLLNGHLINCYSEQNGRYSDVLEVFLVDENYQLIEKIYVMAKIIPYK